MSEIPELNQNDYAPLLAQVATAGLQNISLQFTDLAGALKSIDMPIARLTDSTQNSFWLDGSTLLADTRAVEFDAYLQPDLSTFRLLSTPEGKVARLFCRLHTVTGERLPLDPTAPLEQLLEALARSGYILNIGGEMQFHLSDDITVAGNAHSFHDISLARRRAEFAHSLASTLLPLGATLNVPSSAGTTPLVRYTIVFPATTPVELAQSIVTSRYLTRAIADNAGLTATFMPRPSSVVPGAALILQWRLLSPEGNEVDASAFMAGIIAHTPALCALLAPTVNSYRRLLPSADGPFLAGWSTGSSSAFLRSAAGLQGRSAAFIETRASDPSCNPFLAFAALVAAGLDGLDSRLPLPPALPPTRDLAAFYQLSPDEVIPLPSTLGDALEELAWDSHVRDALGYELYGAFSRLKEAEWSAWRSYVTVWEQERYLDL